MTPTCVPNKGITELLLCVKCDHEIHRGVFAKAGVVENHVSVANN